MKMKTKVCKIELNGCFGMGVHPFICLLKSTCEIFKDIIAHIRPKITRTFDPILLNRVDSLQSHSTSGILKYKTNTADIKGVH